MNGATRNRYGLERRLSAPAVPLEARHLVADTYRPDADYSSLRTATFVLACRRTGLRRTSNRCAWSLRSPMSRHTSAAGRRSSPTGVRSVRLRIPSTSRIDKGATVSAKPPLAREAVSSALTRQGVTPDRRPRTGLGIWTGALREDERSQEPRRITGALQLVSLPKYCNAAHFD